MRGQPTSRSSAFTLVELGVGLFIGAILFIGMMTLLRTGNKVFISSSEQLESLQTAQLLAEIIREDLQNAVLGPVPLAASGTTSAPAALNFTPFAFRPPGPGDDPAAPPVAIPPPIDLTQPAAEFTFFRTLADDDLSDNVRPPLFPELSTLPTADGVDLNVDFTPDRAFRLVAVTYRLQRRQYKSKWTYYLFERILRDGTGRVLDESRIYRNLRLMNLLFVLHGRDWDNVGGAQSFTPPEPPSLWTSIVNDFANGNVIGGMAGLISSWLGGRTQSQPSGAPRPPRDFVYYIQFVITGLSSTPRIRDFEDFQDNTLVGVVTFDALTEKLRTENAALYWNSHTAADGYLTTGTFDFVRPAP